MIEKEYWRLMLLSTEHVCVNAASIDTAASGYGFSKTRSDPEWKHPWNLKNLSSNTNNLLRSLNAVLGVTVPTLHLGMVFSTCCWHRDPHALPWTEYMHEGPPKIWYTHFQQSNHRCTWAWCSPRAAGTATRTRCPGPSTCTRGRPRSGTHTSSSPTTAAPGHGVLHVLLAPRPARAALDRVHARGAAQDLVHTLPAVQPPLHLGMVFSTCCWHRDPHALPWTEYMHEGPPKIWYGIPDEQSANFRHAVEELCPTSCQQKDIWLSSDITMIPPNLLREHKVTLSRVVQNPGEFIIVFPKSYTCSISTGFTVSESVYFATTSWLKTVHQVFQELRSSYEPTTFSLEQLLLALAKDPRSTFGVLHTVHCSLTSIVDEEIRHRTKLRAHGVSVIKRQNKKRNGAAWNVREQDECQVCRTTLFLSKVTGVISKKSDMCLLHALQVIDLRKPPPEEIAKMEMILFYTEKQLNEIVVQLQKRLFP
ncbi:hypothetical protein O0L34_g2333 [Tuta absoluta]|nr:hypothetical protein O0L34_g2333 [Tuta absoluta]